MKIAISGAGYIAAIHARAIQSCGGEITAVIEKFPEKSAAFSKRFGIPKQYITVEDLIQEADVDALVICTPNFLHVPQAEIALKAGISVLVEKPIAINAIEAEHLVKVSQGSDGVLMVAHCWRFDEDVNWLKNQIPHIGKIIRTKGYGVHTNWGPTGWFTQKQLAGGGALVDMGIHALDTARFLLGDPQPLSVYARIGTYYKDFDVDDTGIVIVNWDNGAISYIESGWWQPHSDGPEAATQLYGTQGFGQLFPTFLELPNAIQQKVEVIHSGFKYPRHEHCQQVMYNAQMEYFIDCVHNKQTPIPGGQEGLINMKVIDAAYKSAYTNKIIEINNI